MGYENEFICVNFTVYKITHVKYQIGLKGIFTWANVEHGSNYICEIFKYLKVYKYLRHETEHFEFK